MKRVRTKHGRLTPQREAEIRAGLEAHDDVAATSAWMQGSTYEQWELLDEIEALRLEMVTVLWMTDRDDEEEDDD